MPKLTGFELYAFIFFGKVLEITLQTIRVVLITKGEKTIGSIISFFEVSLWAIVAAIALDGLTEDPLKVVIYSAGFAVGSYIGSTLEVRIGLGTQQLQIIVSKEEGEELSSFIREKGYACTSVIGKGRNTERSILYIMLPRKKIQTVIKMIQHKYPKSVIALNDVKSIGGGYGLRK